MGLIDEIIQVRIDKIRKQPHETWCHYKFEDYNKCPKCGRKLRMTGSINEWQNFECANCNMEFTLNAITEDIESRLNINAMSALTKYVKDFGIDEITNKYGEVIHSDNNFIVFPNNFIACIGKIYSVKGAKYVVGVWLVDEFRWSRSEYYKTMFNYTYCNSEAEIIEACEKIRKSPLES